MRWNGVLLAAGALFCSTAVSAQPTQIEATAAADAERRGAQMFVYDQAAWHATDRFQADLASRSAADRATLIGQLEGHIVEPSSDGTPVTTFFGSDASGRFAVARYTGSSETEMRGGFVPPDSDRAGCH